MNTRMRTRAIEDVDAHTNKRLTAKQAMLACRRDVAAHCRRHGATPSAPHAAFLAHVVPLHHGNPLLALVLLRVAAFVP